MAELRNTPAFTEPLTFFIVSRYSSTALCSEPHDSNPHPQTPIV